MSAHRHKQALYGQFARIGKARAAPRRLELLDLLGQAPRTVEALAEQTAMSVANTSQHLQILRAAGLVESEKEGLFVTYRVGSAAVTELFLQLRTLAEARLAEVERVKRELFSNRADLDDFDAVDGRALFDLLRRGRVVLLDVRPSEEYEAGHIAGAISIPHDELKRRLSELPKSRKIVAYCRGPYCVFAADAVRLLRARGFKATRMEDGVVDFRARGLPVETSSQMALLHARQGRPSP
jgi:rhodanese-related sulfurtransferase/DNA-binding transcriptional ArsR family regulator